MPSLLPPRPRVATLSHPWVRFIAQIVVVLLLVGAYLAYTGRIEGLNEQADEEAATATVVAEMLARTCEATPQRELRAQGLVEECRLAAAGQITEALPADELPDPSDQVINPDVLPDDGSDTPPLPQVEDTSIERAVDAWFATNDLRLATGYEASLREAVTRSLAANPPPRGKRGPQGPAPTQEQVSTAVTAALVANPPDDGRGVTDAVLDGCSVVFSYTDGTQSSVGPVCGPQGPPPTAESVAAAVADYCAVNGDCRGPQGPAGYPEAFTTADGQRCTDPDGDREYTCEYQNPLG